VLGVGLDLSQELILYYLLLVLMILTYYT
jgi:hypothetical protein